ncbi:MAG: hypothetical protein HYS43_01045 [Candidatus Liptonbacteria bacterium]|nr:hypothetical protein [Candidatus Liptonbacteria bacterium]
MKRESAEAILSSFEKNEINGLAEHGEKPTHLETGLAHLYFYPRTVYKIYKWTDNPHDPVTGMLAEVATRLAFLERDFAWNRYFSRGVYRKKIGLRLNNGIVRVVPETSPVDDVAFAMERLDERENMHERLLRGEVGKEELYITGRSMARMINEFPAPWPEKSWYDYALGRILFLEIFFRGIPDEFLSLDSKQRFIQALRRHIEAHKLEYAKITGDQLSISIDNHDENVFRKNGEPLFIDVVPPMEEWRFAVPWLNLYQLSVNVEVLCSRNLADEVEKGYLAYHNQDDISERDRNFARALVMLLNVAHHTLITHKQEIAKKYRDRVGEVISSL